MMSKQPLLMRTEVHEHTCLHGSLCGAKGGDGGGVVHKEDMTRLQTLIQQSGFILLYTLYHVVQEITFISLYLGGVN